jgi:hypothetical protein
VPQDIPLEASETLAFSPDRLAGQASPPSFVLRTPTARDKRFQRRLLNEEGVLQHSQEAMREEMCAGLTAQWGDTYAKYEPVLREYWEALDQHALQKRDNPELEWSYDADIESAIERLEIDVTQNWPGYGRMRADNLHAADVLELSQIAVMVKDWSGLTLKPTRDRGYLTIDSADELRSALTDLEQREDMKRGLAWAQLFVAASKRMFLTEEEEKNSAAPSPSAPTPPNSKAEKALGKSPASAPSNETPAKA